MVYNLYFKTSTGSFNIMGLPVNKLSVVIDAYKKGKNDFTLTGRKYYIEDLQSFQVFTHEFDQDPQILFKNATSMGIEKWGLIDYYIPPEFLEKFGKNVTDEMLGDIEFGNESNNKAENRVPQNFFVHPERINELKKINNDQFDFSRLLQLCNEINDNFSRGNYLSVAMIGRSILNHVPPLFNFESFNQVSNNYGNKSFKSVMDHLNTTMRSIADSYLHDTIRKRESVPNSNQINFSQDLDVLLSEIVRINK